MPDTRSGLEKISALEVRMRAVEQRVADVSHEIQAASLPTMKDQLDDVMTSMKSIESLLLQGHGAVRLARWLASGMILLGFGWMGHAKAVDWLKWLGS